jgi:hypothetical protein
MQSAPPRDTCLAPTVLQSVQLVAPEAAKGWLPSAQLMHCLPADEFVPTHVSHAVRLRLGAFPAAQRAHGEPSGLYQNVSPSEVHPSHLVRSLLGCDPGAQRVHAAPVAETYELPTLEQLVQPVRFAVGWVPTGQALHWVPSILCRLSPRARHRSQLLLSCFGSEPCGHFWHWAPLL